MEFKIGIAVTAEEHQLMTNGVEYFCIYEISDWEGLGLIKQGTKTLLISKKWLLAEELPVVENILSLSDYYQSLGITVYFYYPDFNHSDKTNLDELSQLLDASFYNILIGHVYRVNELQGLLGHEMTIDDWGEWLEWLEENEVAHKKPHVLIEQTKKISLKNKVNWTSLKESSEEKLFFIKSKWNEIEFPALEITLPNLDTQALIKSSQKGLKVFTRDYLKGTVFIVSGVIIITLGIKPLIEMNISNKNAANEWEELKNQQTQAVLPTETPVVGSSQTSDLQNQEQGLIGIIRLPNKEDAIGVRPGTSGAILNKGAGLDESSVTSLGVRGNAVIYGHREEVFWELKSIQKGDKITIETLDGIFTYQVVSTRVTYPEDETIYQYSRDYKITLVTCHPFVYMGATPERFVVEAELIEKKEG